MERLQLQLMIFAITIVQTLTLWNCTTRKKKGAINSESATKLTDVDFDGKLLTLQKKHDILINNILKKINRAKPKKELLI